MHAGAALAAKAFGAARALVPALAAVVPVAFEVGAVFYAIKLAMVRVVSADARAVVAMVAEILAQHAARAAVRRVVLHVYARDFAPHFWTPLLAGIGASAALALNALLTVSTRVSARSAVGVVS